MTTAMPGQRRRRRSSLWTRRAKRAWPLWKEPAWPWRGAWRSESLTWGRPSCSCLRRPRTSTSSCSQDSELEWEKDSAASDWPSQRLRVGVEGALLHRYSSSDSLSSFCSQKNHGEGKLDEDWGSQNAMCLLQGKCQMSFWVCVCFFLFIIVFPCHCITRS